MPADNYQLSRDRAQLWFLRYDQQALIRRWDLPHDDGSLYVTFFGRPYAIDRHTGVVTRRFDGTQAGFEEVLTIFDLLCHEGEDKRPTGTFAPVNSLPGTPRSAGVNTDFHSPMARTADRDPEAFAAACLALGGRPTALGDLGFRFTVFAGLDVILKFYGSDEEFPPSLTLLWDENTLQFLLYETVFYAAGFLLQSIKERMSGEKQGIGNNE